MITNLTHQHHIRILPDNGAQPPGKRQINFGIDLDLADTVDLILNRILDGNDVDIRRIDGGEYCV